ncbi:MAG: hypothetical protein ACYDDI_07550 [Candidatus Acidiferrales bacterium]
MRYRDINSLDDFSRDVAIAVDFIGQKEYRRALEKIGTDLRSKGFVTPSDDTFFRLELELLNLEILRTQCSGRFTLLPEQCHAGVDFLIGLGQTILALSHNGKTILLGRIKKGLEEGLWPLQHELRIAANLSKSGWDIRFHDFEEGGGFDFLVTKDGLTYEVEAKAISAFTGWPIKPENLNKLLVEIKQHFVWNESGTIPFIGATLSSNLSPDRTELQRLVSAFSTVARTKAELVHPDARIRFVGVVPDMTGEKLTLASYAHSRMRKRIVLVNPNHPKLILELDSIKPIQIGRKIIRTINEAARKQFSGTNPAVIWIHINFISATAFLSLGKQNDGKTCLLDGIANATLTSQKRNHLSQLVFTGGSFLHKADFGARSSSRSIIYNSPICRFGQAVVFAGGRTHPDYKATSGSP